MALGPYARPLSPFFPIRTSRTASNIYLLSSAKPPLVITRRSQHDVANQLSKLHLKLWYSQLNCLTFLCPQVKPRFMLRWFAPDCGEEILSVPYPFVISQWVLTTFSLPLLFFKEVLDVLVFSSPRESLWAREVLGFPQILQGEFLKYFFSIGIHFLYWDRKFIVCLGSKLLPFLSQDLWTAIFKNAGMHDWYRIQWIWNCNLRPPSNNSFELQIDASQTCHPFPQSFKVIS